MSGRIGNTLMRAATFVGVTGLAGSALMAMIPASSRPLYTVPAGHRAVVFDRINGLLDDVKGEGIHMLIPGIQKANIMDTRITPKSMDTITGTKDLQNVHISLRMLFRPKEDEIPKLFQKLGLKFSDKVLEGIGNEVLKAVVAHYNADQLLTLRQQISNEIREQMQDRCRDFHILLEDISITDLSFSKDFAKAIEDKQVAQQKSERAKFVVEKAAQEKRIAIIGAEADAEAAALLSNAIRQHGRGMIEVRRIDTAIKVAETLAGNRGNVTYLPSANQGMLLNVDANSAGGYGGSRAPVPRR